MFLNISRATCPPHSIQNNEKQKLTKDISLEAKLWLAAINGVIVAVFAARRRLDLAEEAEEGRVLQLHAEEGPPVAAGEVVGRAVVVCRRRVATCGGVRQQ